MATQHFFNGRVIKLPGAYAETKAIIGSPVNAASFSKVVIIDTGSNAGWGSGSGIRGEDRQGKNSIYHFRSAAEMQAFVKGGPWFPRAAALFRPSRIRETNGVSEVVWIGAKETIPATLSLPFINGSVDNLILATRDEGEYANGVEFIKTDGSSVLTTGYAATIHAGRRDPNKFIIRFWVGTFTGNRPDDGLPYNEIFQETAAPELVAQSAEVDTIEALIAWMKSDYNFNLGFRIIEGEDMTGTIVAPTPTISEVPPNTLGPGDPGSPEIPGTPGDMWDGYILAEGGWEEYSASCIDEALDSIKSTDASFLLSDRYGDDVMHSVNSRLQYFVHEETRFEVALVIAGGNSKNDFQSLTIPAAQYFNSDFTWLVHGGVYNLSQITGNRLREWDSLFHACRILGRIAGVEPQVPPTFKEIDIAGLKHEMTTIELETCLDMGVLTTYWDEDMERYNILKGINTLQNNSLLVNPDGTSPSIQVRRIAAQVNKELIIDAKLELFTQRNGVTITTLSEQYVLDWTEIKLKQKIERQLIVYYEDLEIERRQDAYFVKYKMRPNYEINFLFATGFMIE